MSDLVQVPARQGKAQRVAQGKDDEAVSAYGRAASILYGDSGVRIGLGKSLQNAGRLSEAASTFALAARSPSRLTPPSKPPV